MLPLLGIRVLDLSRLLPGPLATQMLADMGASVCKVELPDAPDPTRHYPPHLDDGTAVNFRALNRNKHTQTINYRTPQGLLQLQQLIAQADVLVEQFRPGVAEAMGFGYTQCAALRPELVYVSVTGYGQHGPLAQAAGHDLNYLAYAGILSVFTDAHGTPTLPGVQIADVAGGSYQVVNAVLGGLLHRERTGKGCYADVSMLDGVLPLQVLNFAHQSVGQGPDVHGRTLLSGQLANYAVYRCADGLFIAVAALEPKFFARLCDAVGHPEWLELWQPDFLSQQQLRQTMARVFQQQPRSHWLQLLLPADVCVSPVLTVQEAMQQAHVQVRQVVGSQGQIYQPVRWQNHTAEP